MDIVASTTTNFPSKIQDMNDYIQEIYSRVAAWNFDMLLRYQGYCIHKQICMGIYDSLVYRTRIGTHFSGVHSSLLLISRSSRVSFGLSNGRMAECKAAFCVD